MKTLSYTPMLLFILLLATSGCQSLEQIPIEYLQAAELSFPPQLRHIAIVNNMPDTPDSRFVAPTASKEPVAQESLATAYTTGDPRIAAEALAEGLAKHNYFETVIICDSALRADDKLPRESTLSQEEVRSLSQELGADIIVSIENLKLKATKSISYLPEYGAYHGALDVQVYPSIRTYLPERTKPMNTLQLNDSIFWESFGGSMAAAFSQMIPEEQMLREASGFAGSLPVKYLVPTWKQGTRYLYAGGSVPMRDAAIYAREQSWDEAFRLWQQVYQSAKSDKKRIRTAHNISVYYEMKDSLATAEEWAVRAQQLAEKTSKKRGTTGNQDTRIDEASDYYLTTLHLAELKERNAQLPKLKMQMSRFEEEF